MPANSNTPPNYQQHPSQVPTEAPNAPPSFDFGMILVAGAVFFMLMYIGRSLYGGNRTSIPKEMPHAREATAQEIRKGNILAQRMIAAKELSNKAVRLNPETGLFLADVAPGGVIPGASNMGKTTNCIKPIAESHAEQGDTVLICDIKGELFRELASTYHAHGYDIYVYAPGVTYPCAVKGFGKEHPPIPITAGANFADFIRHENDTEGVLQITRAINVNAAENNEKRHPYFGPQGDYALEMSILIAKASMREDMITAWSIIGLPKLAERIHAAMEHEGPNTLIPYFAFEKGRGLEIIAEDKGQSNPSPTIQSTAGQTLGKFIGPEIAKTLIKTTLPLDLHGKKVIFFQIDKNNIEASAPLIATVMHMLIRRNISVPRDNSFVLIGDEASRYPLPSLADWVTLERSNGLIVWLAYQQEEQMKELYGDKTWETIRSNLRTRIVFNQGGKESNDVLAEDLGKKTIVTGRKGKSRSSSGSSYSSNDSLDEVDLLPSHEIGKMNERGQCVVISPGFGSHPVIFKDKPIPYDTSNEAEYLRRDNVRFCLEELVPALQQEYLDNFGDTDIVSEMRKRKTLAKVMVPTPESYLQKEAVEALTMGIHGAKTEMRMRKS